MESRQKGLSRKNNAPERRIDRKRENFSRFWLGATGSATHTLSFWRLKRSITLEYNSQLLPFSDTSLDVNLGTFPLSRIPVRTNLCLSLCRGPSCPVTSHQRYSPLALAFNLLRPKCKEWEGRPNCAIDPDCYETSRCVRMKKKTTTYNNNAGNKKQHRL